MLAYDGRRGAPPHARDGRGVVLEPLAAASSGTRARRRATRSRSRRSATTATATRCCYRVRPNGPACHTGARVVLRALALARRRRAGARPARRAPTSPALLDEGPAAAARKVGEEGVEAALAGGRRVGRAPRRGARRPLVPQLRPARRPRTRPGGGRGRAPPPPLGRAVASERSSFDPLFVELREPPFPASVGFHDVHLPVVQEGDRAPVG